MRTTPSRTRRVRTASVALAGLLASAVADAASAQPYTEDRTRHRFAQLLYGLDLMGFSGSGETFSRPEAVGGPARISAPSSLHPRLNIAGTHFWGHTNLYISIPVGNLLDGGLDGGGDLEFNPGVETGLRIYPWRIEQGKLRPFVGAAYAQSDVRQTTALGTGAEVQKSRIPLQLGLTLQRGSTLFELGVGRFLGNELDYWVDRTRTAPISLPRDYLWIGVNRQVESTAGLEGDWESGRTEDRTRRAAEAGALSGWSIAAGPSAAFVLGSSPRNADRFPSIGEHRTVGLFPDLGVGYYHFPWDAHVNLAFRSNRSERSAYGIEQSVGRRSLALEAFKFLFDYHGFVPFVGPVLSREWLDVEERIDGSEVYAGEESRWRAGVVFGWDIRPDDLRGLILRTNLRYTPVGRVGSGGGVAFDQLEFNFIQVVFYPGRTGRIRRALEDSARAR